MCTDKVIPDSYKHPTSSTCFAVFSVYYIVIWKKVLDLWYCCATTTLFQETISAPVLSTRCWNFSFLFTIDWQLTFNTFNGFCWLVLSLVYLILSRFWTLVLLLSLLALSCVFLTSFLFPPRFVLLIFPIPIYCWDSKLFTRVHLGMQGFPFCY